MVSLRDKVFGCYLGAAVGDALGGPLQAMHAERILKLFGPVKEMLPYRKPPGFFEPGRGYAVRSDPGSVTDETLIRAQFARFVLDHPQSRQVGELVDHLLRYGNPAVWPERMLRPLDLVRRGKVPPEAAGASQEPGGGLGWWTPIGIVRVGRPARAAAETTQLSCVWKRPLEQDLLAALQAGVAHALTEKATVETTIEAACREVGPLARALIERAVESARPYIRGDVAEFVRAMYRRALVEWTPDEIDGELPPPAPTPKNIEEPTSSDLLAEQVPLAFAALVFGDGRARATLSAAVTLGRCAKAIGSAAGSLVGALVGRSRVPREWIGTVIAVNFEDVDLVSQADGLADLVEPEIVI